MEPVCKYCNELECKQDKPALKCLVCQKFVHLKCLKRQGTPGDFAGDVFFDFTCIDCSENGEESFARNKMPWVNAILLTIHHLNMQSRGISHHGYFHYKTHIACFIDRNWLLLFGTQVKQKKNWMGTIAGTLSVYNGLLFRSGSFVLGETGWWKLQHNFSPALAAHIIIEMAKDRPKGRPRGQLGMDRTLFYTKIRVMGFMDYIVVENDAPISSEPVPKRARMLSESQPEETPRARSESGARSMSDIEPRSEPDSMILDESYACLTAKNSYADVESFFTSYDFDYQPDAHRSEHNDSSSERTTHTGAAAGEDSDSRSSQPRPDENEDARPGQCGRDARERDASPKGRKTEVLPTNENEDARPGQCGRDARERDAPPRGRKTEVVVRRESLFSTQLNSIDMPWWRKEPKCPKDLVELTEYEEIQLLKQVENLMGKTRDTEKKAYLCRLRAKLALRRLKRHKHLPIFDLDKTVKVLGGYVTEAPKAVADVERVLDRFQRSCLMDSLSGTIPESGYGPALLPHVEPAPLRSPYSGALLKPYIRRDGDTQPLWLRLTDELLRRTHRHVPDYVPPAHATVDYSYVRPQHVPAINSLCAQFFWSGIDLTEALHHPEYSCVVTYKRLVVGCAFLVPDVRRGEAYISFVLTRPEWRRARIATFMLYHLLQTCSGKDVTLHVSPTNPAIFLYQKFGFKVEELIQDFYEKYYDIDHKGCRHALFLRLVR